MYEHSLKVHENGPCAAAAQQCKKARDSQDLNGLMSQLDKDQVVAPDEACKTSLCAVNIDSF